MLEASLAASPKSLGLERSPRPSKAPRLEVVPAPARIESASKPKSKSKSSKIEFGSKSSSKALVEFNDAPISSENDSRNSFYSSKSS